MHVAFALLPETIDVDGNALAAAYRALWPDHPPFALDTTPAAPDESDNVATLTGPQGELHVAPMPVPVPGKEAEEAAQFSLAFLGEEPAIPPHQAHQAHLIIAYFPADGLTLVQQMQTFTRLVTAVLLQTEAPFVHWTSAGVTHPTDFFADAARSHDLPIMLWTGVSLAQTVDARHSLLSLGMSQFKLPDLLLTAPLDEGSEAVEYFFNLLSYVVGRGQAIEEGETVGRTPDERVIVRYEPNPLDNDKQVFCVDLQTVLTGE